MRPVPYSSTPSLLGTKWQRPMLNSAARLARLNLGSAAGSSSVISLPERAAVATGPMLSAGICTSADSEV
eukprot:CAMPEP_0115718282 /NCGR_PEP_ID=MMETSP0272-20121206/77335_1 /TAXON_ID=71861 /ORGANISM="Scrippsiella trochoidea, Strain CCMP3099" /LENGTH=69 /DNA_ID=CAMNT_0003160775 /DNA_START=251 /DNA_END=460 /DNA_ORIENTATION=+